MRLTIKKIAELAGVSAGTVDRALNNRKGVNKEVADRIKDIADSLGYQPNRVAKALVMKRKPMKIGVVIHTPRHPFFEEVMRGINDAKQELKDYGIGIVVKYGRDFDAENQLQLINELLAEDIDALAIVPIHAKSIIDKLNEVQKKGVAVALMVSDENVDCLAYVGCNLERVGKVACGLVGLLMNGRANVLYMTPLLGTLGNIKRLEGFKSIINTRYPEINLVAVCEFPNDDILTYKKSMEVLQSYRGIDTIVTTLGYNNGMLRAVEELNPEGGIKVMALDMEQAIVAGIKKERVIASVIQHPYEQGKKVIEVLHDYLVTRNKSSEKYQYIKCDIVIHESIF